MQPVRVVVLGGSGLATPALAEALVNSAGRKTPLALVLVGRDRRKLDLVAGVSRLLIGADPLISVSSMTDATVALTGADYVINQIRAGGLEARAFDESFPQQFGLPGEETVGPGGFANATRTIPVTLEYARLIERVAPEAVLLSFANPSSLVQYAITHYSHVQTLGLCDGPVHLIERIAQALGAPPDQLDVNYLGMHHFGWVTGVWWQGRDVMPEVLAEAAQVAPEVDPAIVQAFGAVPGSYLNYIFHPDRMFAKKQGRRPRAAELIDLQDVMQADFERALVTGQKPASLAQRQARWYEAIVVPALLALVERQFTRLILNVVNDNTIPWLPAEAIVEVPTLVQDGRVHALATQPAPPEVRALLTSNCIYEMLAVEAIVARDRAKALRALLLNPMIANYSQALATLEAAWPQASAG